MAHQLSIFILFVTLGRQLSASLLVSLDACATGSPTGPSKPLGAHLSTHQGLHHVAASPAQKHAHRPQKEEAADGAKGEAHWVDFLLPTLDLVPEATGRMTKERVAVRSAAS